MVGTKAQRETPRAQRSKSGPGVGRSAAASDPRAVGRASAFDPALLKRIEARIALLLGPVAPRLVTKVSQGAATVDDLYHQLAAFIPSREDQKRFLASGSTELNVAATREKARTPPPTTAAPAATWDPAMLDRARRDLAVHLGPLARVIVRRVYPRARDPRELYELLALEIPNEADREVFRRQSPPDESHE